MTVLVTGGAGFIGSHLVDVLVAQGEPVTVIDDLRTGDHVPDSGRVMFIERSIADANFPRTTEIIYHLAGPVGPVGVLRQAGHIVEQVVSDALRMRTAAQRANCPLIYISTSEIYGANGHDRIPEDAPRVIQAGHTARMEYAVAKLAAETMLLNSTDLDVRIVRPFNVAGPRQKVDGGFVLPRFIAQAKANKPLTVYTPGTQRRAFTHVDDIVDGIWRVGHFALAKTVWNLGNADNECSIAELAAEVVELLSSDSRIDVLDPKTLWGDAFAEAPDKVPNAEAAKDMLGWRPSRTRADVILDAAR